jgi:hypothetical protein
LESGEFVFALLFADLKGEFGRLWDELHPGQQALIPRARYLECRDDPSDKRAGVAFKQATLVQTTYEPIDLTGVPEKTSTVVTMEVTVEDPRTASTSRAPRHSSWSCGATSASRCCRRQMCRRSGRARACPT